MALLERRPRALPTLAALVAISVFVSAGNWQRGRMQQKEALRAEFAAAAVMPPAPLPQGVTDWPAWRYRNVVVGGRYDAARQILIDNRVHAGRVGYHVVAPLALDDGRTVLVNRGWVAAGSDRKALPLVPPPPGTVAVTGRLVIPSRGYLELRRDVPAGTVWQNLDPARFASVTGVAVVDAAIEQSPEGAPADGLIRAWPAPDTGIDTHRIYMAQWYTFAVLAAALWGWFHWRRPRADEGRR